jgi:hypothetical protein
VPCVLQVRAKQLAVQYRQLLQQLHVTASSSWRGSVKAAVNAAIAQHKKQHSSAAGGDGEVALAAAAAALEEAEREQLFRQYVSELSKQEARCVFALAQNWLMAAFLGSRLSTGCCSAAAVRCIGALVCGGKTTSIHTRHCVLCQS